MGSQTVYRCDFKPGELVADRYTIRKTLGEGSFGVVYQVEQGGHKLAFKLLRLWEVPPDIRQPLMDRFEMEFKTGQIDCDYLVRSLDYGTVGGNPFIVMEFCPGGDLTGILGTADPRIPTICQNILLGLNALHVCGKVHRDLKPENVLFKENGIAALTDFGIAGDRTHRMTERNIFGKPNQIFGTYAYMPPEQVNRVRGGATVLPTTDIWSFGVLAYQLLTGELPFGPLESHNDLANYQKRGKDGLWERGRLRSIIDAEQWMRVIDGCLVPNYKHRLQNVEEVIRLLPEDRQSGPGPNAVYQAPQPVQLQTYQPPKQVHGFQLQVMQGEEYGRKYDLSALALQKGRVLTAGRQWDNAIFVKSDMNGYVSRLHCTFEAPENDRGLWLVRDGQWNREQRVWQLSRNGTFVNSTSVGQEGFYLKVGDIIRIGDVALRFENY